MVTHLRFAQLGKEIGLHELYSLNNGQKRKNWNWSLNLRPSLFCKIAFKFRPTHDILKEEWSYPLWAWDKHSFLTQQPSSETDHRRDGCGSQVPPLGQVPRPVRVFHAPRLSGFPAGVAAAALELGQGAELQLADPLAVPRAVTALCWNMQRETVIAHHYSIITTKQQGTLTARWVLGHLFH